MAQVTTDNLEGRVEHGVAVAPRLRPLPEPSPTASLSTAAERFDGALQRAALHKTPGLYVRAWHTFRSNRVAMTALFVLILIFAFVLSAGVISRYVTGVTPFENHLSEKLQPPFSESHFLGTDGNGRDILTRLAYAGRVSLMIAILSATSLFLLGGVIGLISGYLGGVPDMLIMRLVDVLLSIPGLPLLILIATLFSPGPVGLAFVLALV